MICGGHDIVWHSCDFSAAIIARLDAHHDPFPHTKLTYPLAGHAVGSAACCYSAIEAAYSPFGGTVLGNAQATEQAHAEVLAYLAQLRLDSKNPPAVDRALAHPSRTIGSPPPRPARPRPR